LTRSALTSWLAATRRATQSSSLALYSRLSFKGDPHVALVQGHGGHAGEGHLLAQHRLLVGRAAGAPRQQLPARREAEQDGDQQIQLLAMVGSAEAGESSLPAMVLVHKSERQGNPAVSGAWQGFHSISGNCTEIEDKIAKLS